MTSENETVADVIAEMLGARTEFPFVYLMGEPDTPEIVDFTTKEIIEPRKMNIRRVTVKELADRLEAAHKRECEASGNTAALREALKPVKRYLNGYTVNILELRRTVDAALTAPARNCDVGTAEEQAERYGRYCDKFTSDGMHCETCPCCGKVPYGRCEFAWAQLPYESEAAK